ncbi:Tctex1 domain-containing protein 2 [Coelomomyces lativittatus]|nr:Tctex1 domain-containing protein 2 [Coelomomyces lativittatus]KAJ1511962.1 Tctex1 domain-containing protein 2 [Coelomomyces lativittatus]KAJ1518099.1 Tctex1 domain-containing protein 2 [Coelomomyces lativittatus]
MNTAADPTPGGDELITIRPNYKSKFKPSVVQKLIHQVLQERLAGKVYNPEEAPIWTRTIADDIRSKLKELNLDRYKYVVQVVIGELRGEGARMNCRCFWDPDSDNVAQELFTNNTLFCVAAAFGVYFY